MVTSRIALARDARFRVRPGLPRRWLVAGTALSVFTCTTTSFSWRKV